MVVLPHGLNEHHPAICDICEDSLPEIHWCLGPHRVTHLYHVVCSQECFDQLAQLILLTAEYARGEHRG